MRNLNKFLIGSMIIHLLLLLFWRIPEKKPKELEAPKTIWVDLQNKNLDIADILEPKVQNRPKEYKFLGEFDSSTPEETVAALQGKEKELQTGDKKKETTKSKPQKTEIVEKGTSLRKPEKEKKEKNVFSAALPEDFYPDFRQGQHTYLNVLRFPDIQYFVRLKRVFKLTFDPASALQEASMTNKISRGQIETVLGVSVDTKGNLAEIFIFRSSGLSRYDEEALRTIKSSAPFSAPPEKLLDGDQLLRMSWTFVVYL